MNLLHQLDFLVFLLSQWYLKQQCLTNAAPCIVLTQHCFHSDYLLRLQSFPHPAENHKGPAIKVIQNKMAARSTGLSEMTASLLCSQQKQSKNGFAFLIPTYPTKNWSTGLFWQYCDKKCDIFCIFLVNVFVNPCVLPYLPRWDNWCHVSLYVESCNTIA